MTDEPPTGSRRPMARRLRVPFVVNTLPLLVALGGLLWAVKQPLGPSTDGLTLDGEALLKEDAARQGIGEGQPAPGFGAGGSDDRLELATLGGDPVALRDYLGRRVWVVFWATYCHACQLEEPDMRRAFAAFGGDGVELLAIDVGEDAEVVSRYAEERNLPWTILIDRSGATVDAFGAIGTPSHYFIATDGMIRSRAFGRLRYPEMQERLASLVEAGPHTAGASR